MSEELEKLEVWCAGKEWCLITTTASLIGKKWHPVIVDHLLKNGPLGFNALKEEIDGISSKVLSDSFGDLEENKLSNYYAREYDLVAIEDLNIAGMMQSSSNSRNRASPAWGTFLDMLEYKCDREGTHFVLVNPRGTTKECASCGISADKPLWVREHSCPACGFECDRDANAGYNVLSRVVDELGVVHSEVTPVETGAAVDATGVSEAPSSKQKASASTRRREPSSGQG